MENKCNICGKSHATWEHRIYEKLKLVESGVPIETLFIMPDEETGNETLNNKLKEVRDILDDK